MIENLEYSVDIDKYGNVYGTNPPSTSKIVDKINEIINEINNGSIRFDSIKVLEAKSAPRNTLKCSNCDSLLEYGNSDLHEDYSKLPMTYISDIKNYYLTCPVCGIKQPAPWIHKAE